MVRFVLNKGNGHSETLLSAGLPAGPMLGPPASVLFFSTRPSPSCTCRALRSTWLSLLPGEEKIIILRNFKHKLPHQHRWGGCYKGGVFVEMQMTCLVGTALAPSAGWRATRRTG